MRWVGVVVALVCVAALALLGVAMLDPGLVVALVPGGLSEAVAVGRTMQVAGVTMVLAPIAAAVASMVRGRNRAAGWFVVLAVLVTLPASVAVKSGADRARSEVVDDTPACVERSGGDAACPGG